MCVCDRGRKWALKNVTVQAKSVFFEFQVLPHAYVELFLRRLVPESNEIWYLSR